MNINKIVKGGAITTIAAGRIENRYLSLGVAVIGNLMITYGIIKDTKDAK